MAKEIIGQEYNQWLSQLKNKIRDSQLRAALKVNAEMLALYWELGKSITEKQAQSDWGDKVITQLSIDLNIEFPQIKGFSRSNLFNVTKWYQFYSQNLALVQQPVGLMQEIGQQPVDQIIQQAVGLFPSKLGQVPWGHHIQIITKCSSVEEAVFYLNETANHNWSRNILLHQISLNLFSRKGNAYTNFETTLPKPQSDLAKETLKNPYIFDFLNFSEDVQERELEKALIQHIKKFMLELGRGFGYVGNQYNLNVEGDDFFLDMLFYNHHLYCYVIFELKVGAFKPEYAGKLNFYINTVNEKLKGEKDNPTIGVLLCKTPNDTIIKFALKGIESPIGIADYELLQALPKKLKSEMPTVEELEAEIVKETEKFARPIDEKLNRLKAIVQGINNKEANTEKNYGEIIAIIDKVVSPLRNVIEEKIGGIKAFFNNLKTAIIYNGTTFNNEISIANINSKLHPEENIWMIGFEFSLDGFKKAGTKAFDVWYRLEVQFEKYKYSIGPQKGQIWGEPKLYGQYYDEYEIEQISDQFIELILDDLNRKIEQL